MVELEIQVDLIFEKYCYLDILICYWTLKNSPLLLSVNERVALFSEMMMFSFDKIDFSYKYIVFEILLGAPFSLDITLHNENLTNGDC